MEMDEYQTEQKEKAHRLFEEQFEIKLLYIGAWEAAFAVVRKTDYRKVGILELSSAHGGDLYVKLQLDTKDTGADDEDNWESVIAKVPEHSSIYHAEWDMELQFWEAVVENFGTKP